MTVDAKVQIGNSTEFLEGTSVTTTAGANLFREGVVISDPELPGARAEVRQISTALTGDDYGLITHSIIQGHSTAHGGEYIDVKVNPSGAISADVSGSTVALDAPTLAALETISVQNTVSVVDSNQTGVWNYRSGTSGAPSIPANAKILQITAASSTILSGSFTVNGGDVVTIPVGQAITIEPKGNLVSPSITFTNTASYFVEFVV